MDVNFCELKKKKVVNILDGKVLGYITDIIFEFPEGNIKTFVSCEKKGIFKGDEYFFNITCINKIGDDIVLVSIKDNKQ